MCPGAPPPLTCQVDVGERVARGRAHGRQQVDGVVGEADAAGQVQPGELGHVADHQPQRGVTDLQPRQAEPLHAAQLAAVITAWRGGGGGGKSVNHGSQPREQNRIYRRTSRAHPEE